MIFTKEALKAFNEYVPALEHLGDAFLVSGLDIEFHLDLSPLSGMKYVAISYKGRILNAVCIEGSSPAQAVKDVAEAVRI